MRLKFPLAVAIALAGFLLWAFAIDRAPKDEPPAPTRTGDTPGQGAESGIEGAEEAPPRETEGNRPQGDVRGVPLEGRVVDSRRFPVAGARVTAEGIRGHEVETLSGDPGRFRFEHVPVPEMPVRIDLFAVGPDGSVGQGFAVHGARHSLPEPVIVLGEAHRLTVRTVADGVAVAGTEVRVDGLAMSRMTGDDGSAVFAGVPAGAFEVTARASDGRVGKASVIIPLLESGPVEINLVPQREVRISVVRKGTGEPLPGVTLDFARRIRSPGMVRVEAYLPDPPVAPSDSTGRTVVSLFPGDLYAVCGARGPGVPQLRQDASARLAYLRPGDEEVTVDLPGTLAVRIPVVDGEVPVPADGTEVRLELHPTSSAPPPPPTGRMEGTDLVVEAVAGGYFHAVARTPDGAVAEVVASKEGVGRKTSFSKPRTVTIRLRDEEGQPVAGIAVMLRNQGNNPLGPAVVSDSNGVVLLEGLYGRLVDAYVLASPVDRYGGTPIGTVDLARGGGEIDAVVGREREVLLRFTIDGETRLPNRIFLPVAAEEDPAKGEIRYRERIPPGIEKHTFRFIDPPHLPVVSSVDVPSAGPVVHEISLERGGTLLVRLVPPPDGRYRLELQLVTTEGGSIEVPLQFGTHRFVEGPKGVFRASPLKPGAYRVVESLSRLTSEVVAVATERTGGVHLDLSRAGTVSGRVDVPEGEDVRLSRILVSGRDIAPQRVTGWDKNATQVRPDGSFQLRIPGDREIEIRPWHPSLVPAPRGTLRLTSPEEGVVLTLVKGATCRFRAEPVPRGQPDIPPRALLFRKGVEGSRPTYSLPVLLKDGVASFAGYEPGTYRLWIDLFGFLPVVLHEVALGEEETDLGLIGLERGSSVRLRVLVSGGESPPRISLWANHLGRPTYTRGTNSGGQAEVVIQGLGPGRFRVTGGPLMAFSRGNRIDETVEVDGKSDVTLTLDLRK